MNYININIPSTTITLRARDRVRLVEPEVQHMSTRLSVNEIANKELIIKLFLIIRELIFYSIHQKQTGS